MGSGCSSESNARTNTFFLLKNVETIKTDKVIAKIEDKPELFLKGYLKQEKLLELCSQKFSKLKELNISNNKLIDISPLKDLKAPNLKILNLSHNKIENITGKTESLEVYNFPQLEEIDLSYNILTNVFELKAIKALKLKIMNISYNEYEENNLTQNIDIFKFTFDFPELEKLYNEYDFNKKKGSSPKSITEINNEIIENQINNL